MKTQTITELLYIKEKLQETDAGLNAAYNALVKLSDYEEYSDGLLELIEGIEGDIAAVCKSIGYRLKIEKITDK